MKDRIIDAIEFRFQAASNCKLNSLVFPNYKNTATGKALIGIAPYEIGILLDHSGSISDSEIIEKAGTMYKPV